MIEYILMLTDGRLFKTKAQNKSDALQKVFNSNFNAEDDIFYDHLVFLDSVSHIEWQNYEDETNVPMYYLQRYFSSEPISKSCHSTLIPYYKAQFNQIEIADEDADGIEI